MDISGVPPTADFFLQSKASDIVYAPGGKYQEIRVKHHVELDLNSGSPLVFKFPNSEKACYSLRDTFIRFKLRIRTNAGEQPAANTVYPVNGIAHNMWKSVTLYANGIPVSNTYSPYDYKHMLEHLMQNTTQNSFKDEIWGYKKRVAPTGNVAAVAGGANPHLAIPEIDRDTARGEQHFTQHNPPLSAGWTEFIMTPNIDFFNIDTHVVSLPKVEWELRLVPYDNIHCLNWAVDYEDANTVADSTAENYKLQIQPDSVKMFLRTEYMTDDAYIAVMEAGQQHGFIYNYTPTAIKTKTLNLGHTRVEDNDFAPRARPLMYAQTFVAHAAYTGNKIRNPYLFRPPPTLAKMFNYKDGHMVQEQTPVDLQDPHGHGHVHLYMNNLQALGIQNYTPDLSYGANEQMNGFFFKITSLGPASSSGELEPRTSQGSHDYLFELDAGADQNYEVITYIRYETAQIIVHIDGTVLNTFSG